MRGVAEMIEDVVEFILEIFFIPLGPKRDAIISRINGIDKPVWRMGIKVVVVLMELLLLFGIICLCNYMVKGHWI